MKVLVVEDDKVTRLILSRVLTDQGYEVTACTNAEEAILAYEQTFYPLLFLDLFLPGMNGFSFCRWVRQRPGGHKHLILVGTASNSKEDLQKILDAGADDYITKPYHADTLKIRLIIAQTRIRNIAIRASLEANLNQERERLQHLATHDSLTGLLNRSALMEMIERAVDLGRAGTESALLCIDLDNFKLVNDSRGHAAGDKVLEAVASILRSSVRSGDVSARLGGDEFGILLQSATLLEAIEIAERILARIKEFAFSDSTKPFFLGASIGVAMINGTVQCEELLASADSASYAAKNDGKNRVQVYDRNDERIVEFRRQGPRLEKIKEAISGQHFQIVFQPIVELGSLQPVIYEVLIRMNSDGKILLPHSFLSTAERFHLVSEIDRQVIAKTVPHLREYPDLSVAINLSGESFTDDSLPEFIESTFEAAQVTPSRVMFEITETELIPNIPAAQMMINRLRRTGFRFALDDFGVGFSSYHYLKELVPEYLKIDGEFIPKDKTDSEQWIFVEMVNDVAHRLKIKSVAEHVEDELTLGKLRKIGVDLGQGFLFGKPAPLTGDFATKPNELKLGT
jgi:diguanylate cyclase (GGDEF)-like protein